MKKSFILICINFICLCIYSNENFSAEPSKDSLETKMESVNLDVKNQQLMPEDLKYGTRHFYGYIALDSGYKTNPNHDIKSEELQNLDDSFLMARSRMVYLRNLSKDTVWGTATDLAYRSYSKRDELSDDFFKIETGPYIYIPSIKLSYSWRPIYYFSEKHNRKYFYSDFPGPFLKLHYTQIKNLNVLATYEFEARNYEKETSLDSDSKIQTALLRFRYIPNKNSFSTVLLYRNNNAKNYNFDKNIYGINLGYIYYFNKKFYSGVFYERDLIKYDNIYMGDPKKRSDTENYYTILFGYKIKNAWIAEFTYTREKFLSNINNIKTTNNNSFVFSIIYRFNFNYLPDSYNSKCLNKKETQKFE